MVNLSHGQDLLKIFTDLEAESTQGVKTQKQIVNLLLQAKDNICSRMTQAEVREYFLDRQMFENMFLLDIWTPNLDEVNGVVNFVEPYTIIQKIFDSVSTTTTTKIDDQETSKLCLLTFLSTFQEQCLFLIDQNKDEKCKHQLVKHLIDLTTNIDVMMESNKREELIDLLLKKKTHHLNTTSQANTDEFGRLFAARESTALLSDCRVE